MHTDEGDRGGIKERGDSMRSLLLSRTPSLRITKFPTARRSSDSNHICRYCRDNTLVLVTVNKGLTLGLRCGSVMVY